MNLEFREDDVVQTVLEAGVIGILLERAGAKITARASEQRGNGFRPLPADFRQTLMENLFAAFIGDFLQFVADALQITDSREVVGISDQHGFEAVASIRITTVLHENDTGVDFDTDVKFVLLGIGHDVFKGGLLLEFQIVLFLNESFAHLVDLLFAARIDFNGEIQFRDGFVDVFGVNEFLGLDDDVLRPINMEVRAEGVNRRKLLADFVSGAGSAAELLGDFFQRLLAGFQLFIRLFIFTFFIKVTAEDVLFIGVFEEFVTASAFTNRQSHAIIFDALLFEIGDHLIHIFDIFQKHASLAQFLQRVIDLGKNFASEFSTGEFCISGGLRCISGTGFGRDFRFDVLRELHTPSFVNIALQRMKAVGRFTNFVFKRITDFQLVNDALKNFFRFIAFGHCLFIVSCFQKLQGIFLFRDDFQELFVSSISRPGVVPRKTKHAQC